MEESHHRWNAFSIRSQQLPGDLFHRVEVALTLGGLVAAAVLAWRALAAPGSSADLDLAVDPAAGRLGME